MSEINFGNIAKFYELDEVLAAARQGASYRQNHSYVGKVKSIEMLRTHLKSYFSGSNKDLNSTKVLVQDPCSTEEQKLDQFFSS